MRIRLIDTTHYAAHFTTTCSFLSILCYRESSKLLNGTNIVFVGPNGKVMLSGVECSNDITFNAILAFLLDANISQNKYSQCVGNVTNISIR